MLTCRHIQHWHWFCLSNLQIRDSDSELGKLSFAIIFRVNVSGNFLRYSAVLMLSTHATTPTTYHEKIKYHELCYIVYVAWKTANF